MLAHVDEFRIRGSSTDVIRCNLCDPATRTHLSDALLDTLARASCFEAIGSSYNPMMAFKGLDVIALEKARNALPRLIRTSLDHGNEVETTSTSVGSTDADHERAMMVATTSGSCEEKCNGKRQLSCELKDLKDRLEKFVSESRTSSRAHWVQLPLPGNKTEMKSLDLNPPREKMLLVKERLEKEHVWPLQDRVAFAEVLIHQCDFSGVAHCLDSFIQLDDCDAHRKCCPFRPLVCENEGCHEIFSARSVKDHDTVCRFKPIVCKRQCGQMVPRFSMAEHLANNCEKKPLACRFSLYGCSAACNKTNIDDHMVSHAPQHLSLLENAVSSQEVKMHEQSTTIERLKSLVAETEDRCKRVEKENKVVLQQNAQSARLLVQLQTEVRGLREELRRLQFKK